MPYVFEKRVTALLPARRAADNMTLWVRGLWGAAVSCLAVTLLLGVWAAFDPVAATTVSSDDLSQNLESALLASVDQSDQTP